MYLLVVYLLVLSLYLKCKPHEGNLTLISISNKFMTGMEERV